MYEIKVFSKSHKRLIGSKRLRYGTQTNAEIVAEARSIALPAGEYFVTHNGKRLSKWKAGKRTELV